MIKISTETFTYLSIFCLSLILILFPQIDIWFSSLFYSSGQGFIGTKLFISQEIHKMVQPAVFLIAFILVLNICINIFMKVKNSYLTNKDCVYFLLVLSVGSGLIVNIVFKDHWGRARPKQTIEFGGNLLFTPAFRISNQCETNCSFVAGDPSVGFAFFALYFIKRKRKYFYYALIFGAILGFTRISQGAHFFSDVIFSGLFTYGAACTLYILFFKYKQNGINPYIISKKSL